MDDKDMILCFLKDRKFSMMLLQNYQSYCIQTIYPCSVTNIFYSLPMASHVFELFYFFVFNNKSF